MGTVVINGVPLACSRNPPLQINGQKVWSPDININGQMIVGVNINGYDYPPAPAGSVLYLPGLPGQGSTIWDRAKTNNGAITGATWVRNAAGLSVLSFDGNDYVTVTDAASLSFGNGTVDTPLSILAWIYMTDASLFEILSKISGNSPREYLFRVGATDLFQLVLLKSDGTASISQLSDVAVTSLENKWIFVAGTYAGNSLNTGIVLYINGSVRASTAGGAGTYVAMSNTNADVLIGETAFATPTYAKGKIALPRIVGSTLTLAQVANIYNQERSLFGV